MKVLGLITEYNPFHNGHLYHLEKSKSLSGADYTVCVMSGNFIQRGEPAIVDKWARARMAIAAGVDLVIELPLVYAMSSAEFFAYGAVKILDSMGIVENICFGSESGNIDELMEIASTLAFEPEAYRNLLKSCLAEGSSYPAARQKALSGYYQSIGKKNTGYDEILGSSNNILGIEYIKALLRLKSNIKPLTIKRFGNEYNSEALVGNISSATSIRNAINNNIELNKIALSMPSLSLSILMEEFSNGKGPVSPCDLEGILLHYIRSTKKDDLSKGVYISEGLENRIKAASRECGSYDELIRGIATRRYTTTRIGRALFSSLIGISQREFEEFNSCGGPQYIRILGFNRKGTEILKQIKKSALLPVVTKAADFKDSCNPVIKRMLEIEAISTDIYVLGYKNLAFRKAGQEFTRNIVIEK